MNDTTDLSPLDEKVRDICWSPRYRNTSLPDAAAELAEWAQMNGWPAMTDDQARAVLSEEGSAQLLRPPQKTPRALAVEAVMSLYPEHVRERYRSTAESAVKAIEAAGLTISRTDRRCIGT